jgi:hypothetical protein
MGNNPVMIRRILPCLPVGKLEPWAEPLVEKTAAAILQVI